MLSIHSLLLPHSGTVVGVAEMASLNPSNMLANISREPLIDTNTLSETC